ncbi:hypothetical protein J6590_063286 [Homalodisca vitripennis]|nr:hypothetical protein J6590_063286 [Homalodisca vitripennis]
MLSNESTQLRILDGDTEELGSELVQPTSTNGMRFQIWQGLNASWDSRGQHITAS